MILKSRASPIRLAPRSCLVYPGKEFREFHILRMPVRIAPPESIFCALADPWVDFASPDELKATEKDEGRGWLQTDGGLRATGRRGHRPLAGPMTSCSTKRGLRVGCWFSFGGG
jgi:hypothetical protein